MNLTSNVGVCEIEIVRIHIVDELDVKHHSFLTW